jgi:putative selenium metabolism hydrolase
MGNEKQMALRVVEEMRNLGFDSVRIDDVGNVVGIILGKVPGPSLLLDAHMDTVGVLPESGWTHGPFSGSIFSGRIYGRGSTDMKGALAAMICAAGRLDRENLSGKVVLVASIGEESTEGSALRSVVEQHHPEFVVIGEPSGLRLVRAGRGRAEIRLEAEGRPCHASSPANGINAVLEMTKLIDQIESLPMPKHPFLGTGVMCLTDIISVPYPAESVVPSRCCAKYERRLLPQETEAGLLKEIEAACLRSGAGRFSIELAEAVYTTYTGKTLKQKKWYPAWELPEDHPLLKKAVHALTRTGIEPRLGSYQFCTNAAFTIGEAGIPTIGFGPSFEKLTHIVDEYVEISQLIEAQEGYEALVSGLLSTGSVPAR